MSAGKFDILIEQGADFVLSLQLTDSSEDPINIAGDSFTGQIRKSPESTIVIATFSSTIVSEEDGKVDITLSDTITAAISVDDSGDCKRVKTCYIYDIERTRASGRVDRLLEGNVSVSPEVTK